MSGIVGNNVLLSRSAIQKAIVDLSALAPGGILANQQSAEFMEIMTKKRKLLGLVDMRPMTSPKEEINQTLLDDLVLHPVDEGDALDPSDYAVPTYSKVTLDVVEYAAEMRASSRALQDSIARDQLRPYLINQLAKKCGSSMEKIVIQSDTALGSGDLAAMNGILKQATAHQVDHLGSFPVPDVFHETLMGIPQQFREELDQLVFFTSPDAELRYRQALKDRIGQLGDDNLRGHPMAPYLGIPVVGVPYFPQNLGTPTKHTDILAIHPMNIVVGVWKEFTIKTDENISTDQLIVVIRTRFDVKLQVTDASALGVNVRAVA